MLGAITGDTVGSSYEFHNTKDYNFRLFLSESAFTDDSVMTMAVAYWLLSDPDHSYQKLEDAMVIFAKTVPVRWAGMEQGSITGSFVRIAFAPSITSTEIVHTGPVLAVIRMDLTATGRLCE